MNGINSISNLNKGAAGGMAEHSPPSAPVTNVSSQREDSLQQQLAKQLSSEIARIRRQVSGMNQPDPTSADGNGRVLNIGA